MGVECEAAEMSPRKGQAQGRLPCLTHQTGSTGEPGTQSEHETFAWHSEQCNIMVTCSLAVLPDPFHIPDMKNKSLFFQSGGIALALNTSDHSMKLMEHCSTPCCQYLCTDTTHPSSLSSLQLSHNLSHLCKEKWSFVYR